MVKFKYRYCKVFMARYLRGDLPLPVRRRIGRYIDECADCRREYLAHRDFALELSRSLPALGRPGTAQLDILWQSLSSDLQRQPAPPRAYRDFGTGVSSPFSYSLVILAIVFVLLLPVGLGLHANMVVEPPRVPQYAALPHTPAQEQVQAPSIRATDGAVQRNVAPALQNTPSPRVSAA